MSWHFLQGQEEESWEGTCLDGAPSALLNLLPTQGEYFSPDSATECCHASQSGMTCEPSTASRGAEGLMLSAGDSHAKTLAAPEKARGLAGSAADCGGRWHALLAKYDPNTSLWKTRQCSLTEDLEQFLAIWPRWGLMRGGVCWEQDTLERPTLERDVGLWDTPCKGDAHPRAYNRNKVYNGAGQKHLQAQAYEKLTPHCVMGGKLNPQWVEWLMGWPMGWTELQRLEMDRFQLWQQQHGGF